MREKEKWETTLQLLQCVEECGSRNEWRWMCPRVSENGKWWHASGVLCPAQMCVYFGKKFEPQNGGLSGDRGSIWFTSHRTQQTRNTQKTLPDSLISCTRSASCDLSAAGADTRVELTISKMTGSHHILRTSSRPSRAGAAMGAGYLAGVGDCACWFRRKQSWLGLAVPWSPIAIEALPPCSSNGHTHRYIAYVFL
jgi:hypothetical protein